MHTSRNETKRNETEMGEKDSEAPFRFIRNFSVLSVTLLKMGSAASTHTEHTRQFIIISPPASRAHRASPHAPPLFSAPRPNK